MTLPLRYLLDQQLSLIIENKNMHDSEVNASIEGCGLLNRACNLIDLVNSINEHFSSALCRVRATVS